ncbi:MAG TPA: UDP-2,3-diacylglucosamine diphosphatase LpxI [Asticcacaulis sp.]|nr:UDP-2,3-diacylglucosamine diphosphatase LpxI [Asticcacaulis sp.]
MPNNGCLGVVIGGCGFSDYLSREIGTRVDCYRLYSWERHVPKRDFIDAFDLDECIKQFKEHRVTCVMNAGTVNLDLLRSRLSEESGLPDGRRTAIQAQLGSPYEFYRLYRQKLWDADIAIASVGDVFPEFRPRPGPQGKEVADFGLAVTLDDIKERAIDCCSREDHRHVSQSVVFDLDGQDCVKIGIEKENTDALLDRLPSKTNPRTTRILVKILPRGLPKKVDDPTIGPTTIIKSAAAGIKVIVLDLVSGVIIYPDETVALADEHGIAIIGL